MTNEERLLITSLRSDGLGYGTIAKKVGLSANTVKSFCRRNMAKKDEPKAGTHKCLCCGIPVPQTAGRKEKKFCSDKCRNRWWNAHLHQVNRKAVHDAVCQHCGRTFAVYGRVKRKYCTHECYIAHRFGSVSHE